MLGLSIDFSLDFLEEGKQTLPLTVYTLDTKKDIKRESAIYVLFNRQNEIIYIGESGDVKNRVTTHLSSSRFNVYIEFIGIFYKDMDRYERVTLEAMLTKQYKPKYDRSTRIRNEEEAKNKDIKIENNVGAGRVSRGLFFEIRDLIENSNIKKQDIAIKYGVHRNTIGNISRLSSKIYKEWEIERFAESIK